MQEEFFEEIAVKSYEFYTEMANICKKYIQDPSTVKQIKKTTRKNKKRLKDPNKPKQPMSAYLVYFTQNQAKFKKKFPKLSIAEISLLLSTEWNKMTNDKKQPYVDYQQKLKKQYQEDIEKYNANKDKKTISSGKEKEEFSQEEEQEISSSVAPEEPQKKKPKKKILGSSEDSQELCEQEKDS